MMETIQDVLQLILQADDIKYVKNSGILNYGLDLKQVVEREIELSVCKGDKEILLAMNYDIEQCSVQFQIVDCTEEEEKKIIDLYFALNGAEATVDFTKVTVFLVREALKDVFTGESAAKTVVLMRSIITAARMVTATFLNDFIGNTLYFLI